MRVALVSPPFLPVPPIKYGGTELFIAQLAEGLKAPASMWWCTPTANRPSTLKIAGSTNPQHWPLRGEVFDNLEDFNHASWAISDAAADCDIIHLNNVSALMFTRYNDSRFVYTLHHVHEEQLSGMYRFFPRCRICHHQRISAPA